MATLIVADPECRRLRPVANCPAANTSTFQDTIAIWTELTNVNEMIKTSASFLVCPICASQQDS